MTLSLTLSSQRAKRQRNNASQKAHDFRIYFDPPIFLDPKKNYKAALNRLMNMSYSWYNISTTYNNNQLKWRKASGDWQTLVFSDGLYNYTDFNWYLQAETGFVDSAADEKKYIFDLRFDFILFSRVGNG